MLELVHSGGWLMVPIILCSIAATAIVGERLWSLQPDRVAPAGLVARVWELVLAGELTEERVQELHRESPLGRILAAVLRSGDLDREAMKESIEDAGRLVVHELKRYLDTLGTIAAITPLLGLLGTVIGMIRVFGAITVQGVGEPRLLAGGISEALVTTAAGLTVAIPSLLFHRFLRGRVDELVLKMEQEALELVGALQAWRSGRHDAEGAR